MVATQESQGGMLTADAVFVGGEQPQKTAAVVLTHPRTKRPGARRPIKGGTGRTTGDTTHAPKKKKYLSSVYRRRVLDAGDDEGDELVYEGQHQIGCAEAEPAEGLQGRRSQPVLSLHKQGRTAEHTKPNKQEQRRRDRVELVPR